MVSKRQADYGQTGVLGKLHFREAVCVPAPWNKWFSIPILQEEKELVIIFIFAVKFYEGESASHGSFDQINLAGILHALVSLIRRHGIPLALILSPHINGRVND